MSCGRYPVDVKAVGLMQCRKQKVLSSFFCWTFFFFLLKYLQIGKLEGFLSYSYRGVLAHFPAVLGLEPCDLGQGSWTCFLMVLIS